MPDNVNETTASQDSETNPSPPQPSEPHTGDSDYRYQSGPFQGLTAAEAAERYERDVGQAQQNLNQYQNQVAQYIQAMQSQNQLQHQSSAEIDKDLWITDPDRAQQMLSNRLMAQVQQYGQQAFAPVYQGQSSLAKAASQNDPRLRDVYAKYGREVDQLMANVPAQQKLNKEVWDQAAKLIKSNHVDEIAAEKAKELAARMGNVESGQRTSASIPEAQQSSIQKIRESDYGKTRLDYLSDAQLIETARKMGNSIDEYANMIASTHVISHPKKPGEWINKELVKE